LNDIEDIVDNSLPSSKLEAHFQDAEAAKLCILNKIACCEARQKVICLFWIKQQHCLKGEFIVLFITSKQITYLIGAVLLHHDYYMVAHINANSVQANPLTLPLFV